jgi:hypothetical protein
MRGAVFLPKARLRDSATWDFCVSLGGVGVWQPLSADVATVAAEILIASRRESAMDISFKKSIVSKRLPQLF